MARPLKILLGIATFWPIFYIFIFLAFTLFSVLTMVFMRADGGIPGEPPPEFIAGMLALTFFHFFTIIELLGLMIFYIVHAIKDPQLDANEKIMWVLVVVLVGFIGMPIYFILRVWKRPEQQTV